MTINTISNTLYGSAQVQTTGNSWVTALQVYFGGQGQPAAFLSAVKVLCLNTNTGDCAVWSQPVAAQCASDSARLAGLSLPDLQVLKKDLALALVDIRIQFDGPYMNIDIKGKSSTTLEWFVQHTAEAGIGYQA